MVWVPTGCYEGHLRLAWERQGRRHVDRQHQDHNVEDKNVKSVQKQYTPGECPGIG